MPITGTVALRVRELLAAAVLCHVAAGCALNPVSGRPEVMLVSRAQERKLGEDEARRVAASMGLVDAPALTAYVSAVGHRLAEQAAHGRARSPVLNAKAAARVSTSARAA